MFSFYSKALSSMLAEFAHLAKQIQISANRLPFPPSIVFPFQRNEDAGVSKILPPPVLLAP